MEIIGDASSLQKAFAKSEKSAKQLDKGVKKSSKGFGGFGKAIGFATGALGVAGFAGAARAAFEEMADGQKVAAQTTAVLKSTGGAANVTAKHVDDLADAMLKKTGIDDEAIKSGENLLLTFTDVRNEVGKGNDIFDQATSIMADMSTALGQDMKQSALQLGKALNDPVKGVTALRRVGVQFTKAQRDQIKALVDSGHTMDAQKIILRELTKEFGGSAEAAGKTLPGKLNILKESLLNLGGSIAETLTPAITKLVDKMVAWLSNSKNQKAVLDNVKMAAGILGNTLKTLKAVFDALSDAVGGNKNAIKVLIAAYAGFKVLQIASNIRKLTMATRALSLSFMGPVGVAVAVGAAGYALSTFIRKIPGWDKAMKSLGGTAFDLASDLGLVNDQMKQFEGKTILKPDDIKFLRRQATGLAGKGLSVEQIVNQILRTHPNLAKRDVEVALGLRGGGTTFNIRTLVVQAQDPRDMEQKLQRRSQQRPQTRRGPV